MTKKSIFELTSAGITSEAELKELVQSKKQRKPAGFAKTTPAVKIEKSATDEAGEADNTSVATVEAHPTELAESKSVDAPLTLDDVQALIAGMNQAHAAQVRELMAGVSDRHVAEQDQLAQQNKALQAANEQQAAQISMLTGQVETAQQQLTSAQKDAQTLEDLGRLVGKAVQAPMVNTQTRTNDSPGDLLSKLLDLRQSAKSGGFHYNNQSQNFLIRQGPIDWIRDYLVAEGRAFPQTELYQQLEAFGKSAGFLGGVNKVAGPTIGTTPSVRDAFLDTLSDLMRSTSAQFNSAWQFATTVFDSTSAPSKSILVPRFDYLPDPTSDTELEIATYSTFNPPGYAIGTTTDSQALRMTTVPLTVTRYGLGRSISEGSRPVFIPEFHEAHSLVDLMMALDSRLMASYFRFEERQLLALMIQSTAIRYNDNGRATAVPGDVGAGDLGIVNRAFLRSAYTEFVNAGHQSLPDGSYVAYLNATQVEQLKGDVVEDLAVPSPEQRLEVTNMLRMTTGIMPAIRTTSYLGMVENWHIFMGNSFGKGAPGLTNPTVNMSTLGVGATQTVDGFLLAPGAIGRGIAMPMEIRPSGVNPFGMGEAWIWTSDEAFGALDVDAALGNDQQTKVLKIRTTLTEV